jgi:hypothetical protein
MAVGLPGLDTFNGGDNLFAMLERVVQVELSTGTMYVAESIHRLSRQRQKSELGRHCDEVRFDRSPLAERADEFVPVKDELDGLLCASACIGHRTDLDPGQRKPAVLDEIPKPIGEPVAHAAVVRCSCRALEARHLL